MPLREDILPLMKYSQKGMWKGKIMPLREDILPLTKCSQRAKSAAKRHIKREDIKELLMPIGRILPLLGREFCPNGGLVPWGGFCPYWEENFVKTRILAKCKIALNRAGKEMGG